jgi:hypothetical protein
MIVRIEIEPAFSGRVEIDIQGDFVVVEKVAPIIISCVHALFCSTLLAL